MKIFYSHRLITKIVFILLAVLVFLVLVWEAGKFYQLFFNRWFQISAKGVIGTATDGVEFIFNALYWFAIVILFASSFSYAVLDFFSPQLAKKFFSPPENEKAPE